MLSTAQQVKETLLIGTMNVGLPTVDVYSDSALVYSLFRGYDYHPNCTIPELDNQTILEAELTRDNLTIFEKYQACLEEIPREELLYTHHPVWATMLLLPFLFNYMAGWYTWCQMDKRKKLTWLACLLGLYPQLRAANIIRELWRNPTRGLKKKMKFEVWKISETEVFLEAVPTTYIMTYIVLRILREDRDTTIERRTGVDFIGAPGSNANTLFVVTFTTSFITASLGMAKVLKVKVYFAS